jgi:hypothetical protein
VTEVGEAIVAREKHPLRKAMEERDLAAALETLADDVVFWSPVATKPFVGKAAAGEIIEGLMERFEDLEYPEEWTCGPTQIVRWRGRLGGWPVEGIEIFRENDEGKLREIYISARPLSGVAAVAKAIGPALARQRGRRLNLLVVSLLTHFTPWVLDFGERIADRFYRPRH